MNKMMFWIALLLHQGVHTQIGENPHLEFVVDNYTYCLFFTEYDLLYVYLYKASIQVLVPSIVSWQVQGRALLFCLTMNGHEDKWMETCKDYSHATVVKTPTTMVQIFWMMRFCVNLK